MSKILYRLPLYCGAPAYMMKALQKQQTEALRIVTKRKWKNGGPSMVSTKELLKQCNYMSVQQVAFYYSVAAVHKLLVHKQPEYFHLVVCEALASGTKHRYPTSAAVSFPGLLDHGKLLADAAHVDVFLAIVAVDGVALLETLTAFIVDFAGRRLESRLPIQLLWPSELPQWPHMLMSTWQSLQ